MGNDPYRRISSIKYPYHTICPHHALEFVNSLLTSSFNIGISLGAFLGGLVSVYYGVHDVLWVSILLLSITFLLSFVTFPKDLSENEEMDHVDKVVSPSLQHEVD
ncbi:hypothetical protein OKW96_20165 [Sphingobacterium sp. KU25419]|nr:hypothetical protein OKW96_20165 [Sphingobacterium sp. KU25419]